MSLMPLLPLNATQIINPIINSMILANHDKVEEIQPAKVKYFLDCKISFIQIFQLLKENLLR